MVLTHADNSQQLSLNAQVTLLCCVHDIPFSCCPLPQLLLSAKQQLETVVQQKLEEAVAARDHPAVLRFVLLHQPLAIPDKGISRYIDYMRLVLGSKARELYQSLDAVLEPPKPGKPAAQQVGNLCWRLGCLL